MEFQYSEILKLIDGGNIGRITKLFNAIYDAAEERFNICDNPQKDAS